MGIASMVLGIITLIFLMFCGCVSSITAPIGLVLGIIDLLQKKDLEKPKGMAIAGVVMCGLGILIQIVIFILFVVVPLAAGGIGSIPILKELMDPVYFY